MEYKVYSTSLPKKNMCALIKTKVHGILVSWYLKSMDSVDSQEPRYEINFISLGISVKTVTVMPALLLDSIEISSGVSELSSTTFRKADADA